MTLTVHLYHYVILFWLLAGSLLVGIAWGLRIRKGEVAILSRKLVSNADLTTRMCVKAGEEQKLRMQTVEAIAIIEKERNTWKDLYFKAGTGHGAAQAMLMRELGRLSLLCQRNGIKNANVSADVSRIVAEYQETIVAHVGTEKSAGIVVGSPVAKPAPTV